MGSGNYPDLDSTGNTQKWENKMRLSIPFSASFTAILYDDIKIIVPFVSTELFRLQYFVCILSAYAANPEGYQFHGFKVFGLRQKFRKNVFVIDPIAIWLIGTDD